MQSNNLGFNMNALIFFFFKYTWTEIGIYFYCYRNKVLWIIADYTPPLDCGALTRMTTKKRTSRNLKPQVFPFPNTLYWCFYVWKRKIFSWLLSSNSYGDITTASALAYYTVRQPLCSLEIEKLLQPTFQMAPPRSPARFFYSIMPYINFAYVHR